MRLQPADRRAAGRRRGDRNPCGGDASANGLAREPLRRLVACLLTASALPAAGATPDVALLARKGDFRAVHEALQAIEQQIPQIVQDGGDAPSWWTHSLLRLGVDRIDLPVKGAGRLHACAPRPEVHCDEQNRCSELRSRLTCVVDGAPEGTAALSCGSVTLRVDTKGDVHDLERCFEQGSAPIAVGSAPPNPGIQRFLATLDDTVSIDSLFDTPLSLFDGEDTLSGGLEAIRESEYGAAYSSGGLGSGGGLAVDEGASGSIGYGSLRTASPPRVPPTPWQGVSPLLTVKVSGVEAAGPAAGGLFLIAQDRWRWLDLQGATRAEGRLYGAHPRRKLWDLCTSADGRYQGVVFGSAGLDTAGGSFEVWDLGGSTPVRVLDKTLPYSAHACAFTADGAWFAVSTREALRAYQTDGWILRRSRGDGDLLDQSSLVAASPSEPSLMIEEDGRLLRWDLLTGAIRPFAATEAYVLDAAWTRHGLVHFADQQLHGADPAGASTFTVPVSDWHHAAAGDVLIASQDGWPVALDARTGALLGGLRQEGGIPAWFAISSDARLVIETVHGEVRAYRIGSAP